MSTADRLGMRAWSLLLLAREAKREASRATSHRDVEFALFAAAEYVKLARRANHQSIRAREMPKRWTPPVLRSMEVSR